MDFDLAIKRMMYCTDVYDDMDKPLETFLSKRSQRSHIK